MKHEHDWVVYDAHDPYAVYARCSECGLVVYKTVAGEVRYIEADASTRPTTKA